MLVNDNYLSYAKYQTLFKQLGITITITKSLATLASYAFVLERHF